MLFPEKLDTDKKGRPSTAGSKIKVSLVAGRGQERQVLLAKTLSLLVQTSVFSLPLGFSMSEAPFDLQSSFSSVRKKMG